MFVPHSDPCQGGGSSRASALVGWALSWEGAASGPQGPSLTRLDIPYADRDPSAHLPAFLLGECGTTWATTWLTEGAGSQWPRELVDQLDDP